eukprot:488624_1
MLSTVNVTYTMIVLSVRNVKGNRLNVHVNSLSTVEQVKQAISKKCKSLPHQMRLIFAGKLLQDNQTVHAIGLTNHSELYLVQRPEIRARNDVWLLIKGCTESPNGISVSKRKGFAGNYLYGMKYDFAHMQEYIEKTAHTKLHNMVSNMVSLTKQNVLDAISETCKYA